MIAMAPQITGVSMVCSTVCSGADQRIHQSSFTGLRERNSAVTDGFPSQKASNAENVSINDVIMNLILCQKLFRARQGVYHIDALEQGCSNSLYNALELLQPCTKPSIWCDQVWLRCKRHHMLPHVSLYLYSAHHFAVILIWMLFVLSVNKSNIYQ